MKRLILFSLILTVVIPVAALSGEDEHDGKSHDKHRLQGNYAYSISQRCEVNLEQLTDDPQFLTEPVVLIEWSIDGMARLRKDGTGESTFRALRFIAGKQSHENTLSGWSEGMCDLSYEVNKAGRFSGMLTCNGTNSDGKSFTTSEFQVEGSISKDGQSIVLGDTSAIEEAVAVDNFGTLSGICGRSGSAVRVRENKDD